MKKYYILLLSMLFVFGCSSDRQKRAQTFASRASWLMSDEKYAEAIPLMKKASALRPDCAEYHVGIAMASVMVKDYKTAKDEYLKALPILRKQSQDDPKRFNDLCLILTYLNRDKEAKTILDSARNKFPKNEAIVKDLTAFKGFSKYRIES